MRTLSICIPTWNRVEMTLNSFKEVYNDDRVEAIIIVDDASEMHIYNKLKEECYKLSKVKLYRNLTNRDCYANKYVSISLSPTDYCIILDSDNQIDTLYLDKIFEQEWAKDMILAPDWAKPTFNYTEYSDLIISKDNLKEYIDKPMFETCLNCMNYFVNKNAYCDVWDATTDPVTSDSLFQNYNWLMSGRYIHIVHGLRYEHLVHNQSHYINNVQRTGDFREILIEKIRKLN
jgi:glycosyltransferase involved in cell wall biosynthesis